MVADAAQFGAADGGQSAYAVQGGLDAQFQGVAELTATGPEELDAVVLVRVVRRADHHARVGVQGAGQVRHAGGGQHAQVNHMRAPAGQASGQRGFEHVARLPRVLADHHADLF